MTLRKQEDINVFAVSEGTAGNTQRLRKSQPVTRLVVDVTGERAGAFEETLASIDVGERIIYHIGEHCAGAHRVAARSAYEGGRVTLSLRKRSKHLFEYIAIKIAERG